MSCILCYLRYKVEFCLCHSVCVCLPNLSSLPNEIVVALISSGLNVYPVKSLLHLFLWGELLGTARSSNFHLLFIAPAFNFTIRVSPRVSAVNKILKWI